MRILDNIKLINGSRLRFRGFNILALSQIFLFEISQSGFNKSLSQYLKAYSLDNLVKYIITLAPNRKMLKNPSVLFVNDIYNYSMISNSRILQKYCRSELAQEVVCDKRIGIDGSAFLYSYARLFKTFFDILKFSRDLFFYSTDLDDLKQSFQVSKFRLWLNICDSLFIINCIESLFEKNKNISSVVLNSDVHKVSRAIVFYCRMNNIKTYVLQHGETIGHFGYLPVYSDKVFVWGSYSYNWFVQNKTNKDHLIITGAPKVDDLDSIIRNQEELVMDNLSILVILNPIGESLCEDFLKIIKDAFLRTNKKYKLSIKLHPSSRSYKHLPAKILQNIDYKIYYLDDLHALIEDNDVVISTPSTAGSEVVACHKPLLTMHFAELPYTLAYESYDCNIKFHDLSSLIFYLDDIDNLQSKLIFYDRFIKDYFYKLDGNSSKRIWDIINE